jgi:hypothetical protein
MGQEVRHHRAVEQGALDEESRARPNSSIERQTQARCAHLRLPLMSNVGPHRGIAAVDFTRAEKKQLRALAAEANEIEARQLLDRLDGEFNRWKRGEIGAFELISAIHKFHDYDSRDLWSLYNGRIGEDVLVSRAVGLGVLPEAKVPPAILAKLNTEHWKKDAAEEAPEE